MKKSDLSYILLNDINKTIKFLFDNNLVRDYKGTSAKSEIKNSFSISFNGKNETNSILYDSSASIEEITNVLLENQQYLILLFDKSIIQAEFYISNNKLIKERLLFIKKHNRDWDDSEISLDDNEEYDWYNEEKGIPIVIRFDYDPANSIDIKHPESHLTISNMETCRIPVKSFISFSEFIKFIINNFYSKDIDITPLRLGNDFDTITKNERKLMHIDWE